MVFKNGLGLLNGTIAKMFVDLDATPRCFKPRSVSYYFKEKVKQELARLQDDGMISCVCFQIGPPRSFLLLKTMGLFTSVEIIKLQQI